MNWNPYKRIAELEAMHIKNIAVLDTLADKLTDLSVKHNALSELVIAIDRQINPHAAEQKRIKQREYSKAHYAKKKARAKKNEYQRAYRARKKAAAQAVGGTA